MGYLELKFQIYKHARENHKLFLDTIISHTVKYLNYNLTVCIVETCKQ